MNSRKSRSITTLTPIAFSLLLSACLMGENQTFFDYRNESETEDPGNTSSSTIGNMNPPSGGISGNQASLCCNTQTAALVPASQTGCEQAMGLIPIISAEECNQRSFTGGANITRSMEQFSLSTSRMKKIDFLFVVDNSGSMEDNQAKLASGFEAFANTFFRREDLDICIAIITSDRYLGRFGSDASEHERRIPCTKPATWAMLSPAIKNAYIDRVIQEFRTKINVGTRGNSLELIGKSLVTYLHNLDQWDESRLNERSYQSFFRRDSVANISILTDENNWFYRDPQREETRNDLPVITNAPIYNSSIPLVDTRKGIKNHLDDYFTAVQPDHAASWSVNTFLETTLGPVGIPALSMNLDLLAALTGRESAKTNIGQSASGYADLYQSIGTNLVNRAQALHLSHSLIELESVVLVHQNQVREPLLNGRDFTVLLPNGIVLSDSINNAVQAGDTVEIQYRHLAGN